MALQSKSIEVQEYAKFIYCYNIREFLMTNVTGNYVRPQFLFGKTLAMNVKK